MEQVKSKSHDRPLAEAVYKFLRGDLSVPLERFDTQTQSEIRTCSALLRPFKEQVTVEPVGGEPEKAHLKMVAKTKKEMDVLRGLIMKVVRLFQDYWDMIVQGSSGTRVAVR